MNLLKAIKYYGDKTKCPKTGLHLNGLNADFHKCCDQNNWMESCLFFAVKSQIKTFIVQKTKPRFLSQNLKLVWISQPAKSNFSHVRGTAL